MACAKKYSKRRRQKRLLFFKINGYYSICTPYVILVFIICFTMPYARSILTHTGQREDDMIYYLIY